MPRAVLDMMDRRPVWAMPEWVPDRIREAFPPDWELVVIDEETDGSGDGAARVSPAVLQAVGGARVYFGYGVPEELLEAAPRLEWVHSGAAGVGSSLTPAMKERAVLFTNSAGVHAPPMAETVLAMILHFGRGLDLALENQRRGVWSTAPFYVAGAPLTELSESVVGLVGFGGIGREVARRVAALGARVVALRRSPQGPGDVVLSPVAGAGTLGDAVTVVHGEPGLDRLLREADYVVVAVPETEETRGLLDAPALGRLKPGAVVINVGRGRIVDQGALVDALRQGRLRGAGLDVFAREPLPEGHPLWSMPNVVVTPHVSAVTRRFWERETDLIVENVRRYLEGRPLLNLVRKELGY